MHDVIICTTAVDRPELHKHIFPKYLEFLDGVDFHWLIHINNVWGGVSNAVDELKEIVKDLQKEIRDLEKRKRDK